MAKSQRPVVMDKLSSSELLTKQNNSQPDPTITLIRAVMCHTYHISESLLCV